LAQTKKFRLGKYSQLFLNHERKISHPAIFSSQIFSPLTKQKEDAISMVKKLGEHKEAGNLPKEELKKMNLIHNRDLP
jgi:hypothetical protein